MLKVLTVPMVLNVLVQKVLEVQKVHGRASHVGTVRTRGTSTRSTIGRFSTF